MGERSQGWIDLPSDRATSAQIGRAPPGSFRSARDLREAAEIRTHRPGAAQYAPDAVSSREIVASRRGSGRYAAETTTAPWIVGERSASEHDGTDPPESPRIGKLRRRGFGRAPPWSSLGRRRLLCGDVKRSRPVSADLGKRGSVQGTLPGDVTYSGFAGGGEVGGGGSGSVVAGGFGLSSSGLRRPRYGFSPYSASFSARTP